MSADSDIIAQFKRFVSNTVVTNQWTHIPEITELLKQLDAFQQVDTVKCSVILASGNQCSRKRKHGMMYCGTHLKNRNTTKTAPTNATYETQHQLRTMSSCNGIKYFVDDNTNVYDTEDVLNHADNPAIIGHYKMTPNGEIDVSITAYSH